MVASRAEVWQIATVVETETVALDIRRIVFRVDRPLPAASGAHVDVRVRVGGAVDRRSYSVVDSSASGDTMSLSVFTSATTRGGALFMNALAVGDSIEMTQPVVDFPLRTGAARYLLLAGGIGITGVMEMARQLRLRGADYELIYVGHSRSQMAYLDRLITDHADRLRVHVSDERRALDVEQLVSQVSSDTELYMCGPIRLMDAVRRAWTRSGLPLTNLRFETFGNSGWYEAQEFIVEIAELGITTTVGPHQSMLEALQSAGADMMYDCRKGECGLCEVRLVGLEGEIDHRDVFYSERQKDARSKMCCCVSRAVSLTGAGPAVVRIQR